MTAAERIEWLAGECGVSPPTVRGWLYAKRNVPSPSMKLIEELMARSLTSDLQMTPDEFAIFQRAAEEEGLAVTEWIKRTLKRVAFDLLQEHNEVPDNVTTLRFSLPLRGEIAAGSRIDFSQDESEIALNTDYGVGHYALKVNGRSMEPTIPDGSTVVIRDIYSPGFIPRRGQNVVYVDGSGSSLKRFSYRKADEGEGNNFGKIAVLESINDEFADLQPLEDGRIVGVVVDVLPED